MSESVSLQPTMSRAERQDLAKLVRQRARVEIRATEQRSAELMAEFDEQLSRKYTFDEDGTWKAAYAIAESAVEEAQALIATRCAELGIPKEFAPGVNMGWYERGENDVARRRTELRRAARSRVEAPAAAAKVTIERTALEAQTQLVADGLTSGAAKAFLAALPTVASLMPAVNFSVIEAEVEADV